MGDGFIHHTASQDTSKGAWDQLEKLFGAKQKNSKISFKIQFFGLDIKDSESLSAQLNKMKSITQQMVGIGTPIEEEDSIAILLKSMTLEEYRPLVATLKKLLDPTIARVEATLIEEDKRIRGKVAQATSSEEKALFSRGPRPRTREGPRTKITYHHCGKIGHIAIGIKREPNKPM